MIFSETHRRDAINRVSTYPPLAGVPAGRGWTRWRGLAVRAKTLAIAALFLTACQHQEPRPAFFEGYERTTSGLYFQFHESSHSGQGIHVGEVLVLRINSYWCENHIPTEFSDTTIYWIVEEPIFPGDFSEGLLMMQVGDSASFIFPADSVIWYWGAQRGDLDHFCDYFRISVRVVGLTPEDCPIRAEINCPIRQIMEQQQIEQDRAVLADFIARSEGAVSILHSHVRRGGVTIEPNTDGVYVVVERRGNGRRARDGREVVFHYTAFLLDGSFLSSSCEDISADFSAALPWHTYEPMAITLGAGDWMFGIDNALRGHRAGTRLRLYMPPNAIFGPRGGLFVPAFQPIILEVEILDIR